MDHEGRDKNTKELAVTLLLLPHYFPSLSYHQKKSIKINKNTNIHIDFYQETKCLTNTLEGKNRTVSVADSPSVAVLCLHSFLA